MVRYRNKAACLTDTVLSRSGLFIELVKVTSILLECNGRATGYSSGF